MAADEGVQEGPPRRRRRPVWDAGSVRALRRRLGLSQEEMAQELGARQQTVSEWETGRYQPRGTSARLLAIIAERAGFHYETRDTGQETQEAKRGDAGRP